MLEPFLGKSEFANCGQRVVEGQRLMQSASDIMLGWLHAARARRPRARLLHPAALGREGLGDRRADGAERRWTAYAKLCGWTLAQAHARSGDAIAIGSYLGSGDVFDQALAEFAERYADQNERDYAALKEAADSGRVKAETGL